MHVADVYLTSFYLPYTIVFNDFLSYVTTGSQRSGVADPLRLSKPEEVPGSSQLHLGDGAARVGAHRPESELCARVREPEIFDGPPHPLPHVQLRLRRRSDLRLAGVERGRGRTGGV